MSPGLVVPRFAFRLWVPAAVGPSRLGEDNLDQQGNGDLLAILDPVRKKFEDVAPRIDAGL